MQIPDQSEHTVDVLQAWLVVGIPVLAVAALLFLRRSPLRAVLGYLTLLIGFGLMVVLHPPSAAVLGGLMALLYAAGRGGNLESEPMPTDRERAGDDPETTDALRS
jgi:hypothetical protein